VKWLLDTNTLSELTKPAPAPALVAWLRANEADAAISAITIGELMAGIERLSASKKRRTLERTLSFLREDYSGRIFDFTEGVAVEWGRLIAEAQKAGRNLSVLDSQIEATAIHYGLIVVTRNAKDFFYPVTSPW
jgi:toxin FitB